LADLSKSCFLWGIFIAKFSYKQLKVWRKKHIKKCLEIEKKATGKSLLAKIVFLALLSAPASFVRSPPICNI
jgi:hypothetical protein